MKRRIITIAVSFLLCIGMVGAGFAAWIITGNTNVTEQGTITVENVVDNRLEMSFAWTDTGATGADDDAKIVFGKHATDTCSWLTSDGETEKLTAQFTIAVNNHKALIDAGLTYSFAFNLVATGDGYQSAATANLVGALPTIDAIATPSDVDTETATYNLTITFAWGSAFDSVNPLTKYKDTEYDKTTADTVKEQLENLYNYLTGVGYQLTVTGTVSQANA